MRVFEIPEDTFLRGVLGYLAGAAFLGVAMANHQSEDIGQMAGYLMMSLIAPRYGGALVSDLPIVMVLAMACAAGFALTLCVPALRSKGVAKFCFGTLVVLSLFTLWLEDYLTYKAILTTLIEVFLKFSFFFVDLGVTVFWLFMWACTVDRVNQLSEQPATASA